MCSQPPGQEFSPPYKASSLLAFPSGLGYVTLDIRALDFAHFSQFGGLFLPKTGYSDSFFFCSITLLVCTILYVLFVCPESRFPPDAAGDSYARDFRQLKSSPIQAARHLIRKFISALLSPISIFAPKRIRGTNKTSWNMTLVGLSFFIYCVSIVSRPICHRIAPERSTGNFCCQISLRSTCLLMDHSPGEVAQTET